MRIVVNGEERQAADGLTVAQLLGEFPLAGRYVAVEVNREVVPRARHGEHRLVEGDRVEIVTLVGGG